MRNPETDPKPFNSESENPFNTNSAESLSTEINSAMENKDQPLKEPLPDIAAETTAHVSGNLDRVGMSNIETVLQMQMSDGQTVWIPAKANAYVNVNDPDAKGIHMSRIYLALQDELQRAPVSPDLIRRTLKRFLETHHELSDRAELNLAFVYASQRKALISDHVGWRHYPVEIRSTMVQGKVEFRLKIDVTYSSTCPCSAALSRQLLQEKFQADFDHHRWLTVAQVNDWLRNNGSLATPHSQRSVAQIEVALDDIVEHFPIMSLIDRVEDLLGTPVQTAVKRIDEQEFARANGENLMFCEDAARKIRDLLENDQSFLDYHIRVDHLESLHPHDATAVVVKGIEGGFTV